MSAPLYAPGKHWSDKQGDMVPVAESWVNLVTTLLTQDTSAGGGLVSPSRLIATTSPLQGGGDLTADRTLSIALFGIDNTLLAQMPPLTIKGNANGVLGNANDLSVAQVTALLAVFTSALQGLVPASGGGSLNVLRADGTWTAGVTGTWKTGTFTVATLPAAATAGAGARAFVTDATVTTFASIVAGTGANAVPVFSDATNWRIG